MPHPKSAPDRVRGIRSISPQTRTQPRRSRHRFYSEIERRSPVCCGTRHLSRQLRYIVIRGTNMRPTLFITVLASALAGPMASIHAADQPADKPEYGTGQTHTPETKGEKQP